MSQRLRPLNKSNCHSEESTSCGRVPNVFKNIFWGQLCFRRFSGFRRWCGPLAAIPFFLRTGTNTTPALSPTNRLPPSWDHSNNVSRAAQREQHFGNTNNGKSMRMQGIEGQEWTGASSCPTKDSHIPTQSSEPRNWQLEYCDVRKGPSRESEDIIRGQ